MSKEQILSDALTAISVGQAQVMSDEIGKALDAMAIEQKASDGTLGQGDLDAAVEAATAPLKQALVDLQAKDDADVQALADVKAQADSAVADALKQVEDLKASKAISDQVAADLNAHIAGLEAVVGELHSLFPAPPVVVEPAPEV